MNTLPAFKITLENQTSYITSMSKGVTLDDAKQYFLGKRFTQPDETSLRVVNVEEVLTSDEWEAKVNAATERRAP